MKPTLQVHVLSHDSETFLAWALRYWTALGARVIVHDGGPKGFSSGVAAAYGAECRPWSCGGQLNDELAKNLKNTCWKGTDADWVVCADADELLHFPLGLSHTLGVYEQMGACIIKPHGFEMFSEKWFEPNDHPGVQITDLVKDGAPDNRWYAKPILFSPKRVAESGFGYGAHESDPVLKTGLRPQVGENFPKANPPTQLLHFHQLGTPERLARRYDETLARFSSFNKRAKLGNFTPGNLHVEEKRALIIPNLRRVIE